MNKFFEYIQPTIVRASYDETLPENVRGRFFINLNVFGIRYFEENYILTENSNNLQYLLLKENSGIFQLEDTLEAEDIIDIPRIYIAITDKFINDNTDLFKSFIYQASVEHSIWVGGIDNFVCGVDYYVNNTLYNYLALTDQLPTTDFGCRLPNYLDENGYRTQYWMDLSHEPYKNYNDLEYFNEKNKLLDQHFSEDELNNFYSSFCGLILEHTNITDENKNSGNNPIYNLVLNYYANFKNDSASSALQLVLGSLYTSTTNTTNCGCNSTFAESTTYSTLNCHDMYLEAMSTWVKTMFGDKKFYEDWFNIQKNGEETMPNDVLIDNIVLFINEFFNLKNTLTFTTTVKKSLYGCGCPTTIIDENGCNKTTIQNFLNIMEYVKNQEIEKNKNKIKIYGESFGELLSKLQF